MVISNRELLREYKLLKEKLISGEVKELTIPQANGMVLRIEVIAKEETPFQRMVRRIKKKSYPNIKRPDEDLFDYVPSR